MRTRFLGLVLPLVLLGTLTVEAQTRRRGNIGNGPDENQIRFTVTDLKNAQGSVLCGLYSNEETWLGRDYLLGSEGPIEEGKATCIFKKVPPGTYGISAFHDEDGDQSLDTKIFGIPKEGYCTSRNARARFGPPSWEDARFRFPGGGAITLSARIRY